MRTRALPAAEIKVGQMLVEGTTPGQRKIRRVLTKDSLKIDGKNAVRLVVNNGGDPFAPERTTLLLPAKQRVRTPA